MNFPNVSPLFTLSDDGPPLYVPTDDNGHAPDGVHLGTVEMIDNELDTQPKEAPKPEPTPVSKPENTGEKRNEDDLFLGDELEAEFAIEILDMIGSGGLAYLAMDNDTEKFEMSNKQKQKLTKYMSLILKKHNIKMTPESALIAQLVKIYGMKALDAWKMREKNMEISRLNDLVKLEEYRRKELELRILRYENNSHDTIVSNDEIIPDKPNRFVFDRVNPETNQKTTIIVDKEFSKIGPPLTNDSKTLTWIDLCLQAGYDYKAELITYLDKDSNLCNVMCHSHNEKMRYIPLKKAKDSMQTTLQRCFQTGKIFERYVIHTKNTFIDRDVRALFNEIQKNKHSK